MNSHGILQWNVQGIRNKKDEILEMVDQYKVNIIFVQETKLADYVNFNIPGYSVVRKDGTYNRTSHGGVAIFIHDSMPCDVVNLQTPIQEIAVRAKLRTTVTICNIYSPGSQELNCHLLEDIYQQLPQPMIILGDFNAHYTIRGSEYINSKERKVDQFVNHNIVIMNSGAPTRIVGNTETAIYLTICTAPIEALFHWRVAESPGDSDHCPIFVTYEDRGDPTAIGTNIWRIRGALWDLYESSMAWESIPREVGDEYEELIADIYRRIDQASREAIPVKQGGRFYPRPWWNYEVKESKIKRERLYQEYGRNRTDAKLIAWKRSRAQYKRLIKKRKKEAWIEFVQKLRYGTHPSVLYEAIRKIKGRPPKKIPILSERNRVYSTVPEIAENFAQTFHQVSSNDNFTQEFLTHKTVAEQEVIYFESNNTEPYNRPFTVKELDFNLFRTKNITPGNDEIHYQMLKRMPLEAKEYLCRIFNKLGIITFSSTMVHSNYSTHPQIWKES